MVKSACNRSANNGHAADAPAVVSCKAETMSPDRFVVPVIGRHIGVGFVELYVPDFHEGTAFLVQEKAALVGWPKDACCDIMVVACTSQEGR